MVKRKVKWGIIGSGGIALKRMIPAMKDSESTDLIAVHDIDLNISRRIANDHNCKYYYDSVNSLLENNEIEVVYIASPVFMHYGHIIKAAEAKKHILCEKPIALTIDQCYKIKEKCNSCDVKFMIGFMMRFHAVHSKVKEIISEKKIGDVILTRAQLSHYHVEYGPNNEKTWRHQKELAGGGSLMDMGIHCIDLLRYWIGEVSEVVGMVDTLSNSYDVEDTSVALLNFKNGAIGIVDSCFNIKGAKHVFEVYGTKGCLYGEETIGQLPTGKLTINIDDKPDTYHYLPVNMYRAELECLNDCIINDKSPELNVDEGRKNLEIVYKIYESSSIKRIMRLS